MRKTVVLVVSMVCALGLLQIAHAGLGDGLTCPPGWSVSEPNENDLIKQCVAPGQNAFIELYAAQGNQIPLGQLMDGWATQMAQRGLPFQQQLSEVTGQVSGFPALVRSYRGKVQGETFDSSIVVCHRGGVNYVFQALYKKLGQADYTNCSIIFEPLVSFAGKPALKERTFVLTSL
jgi:hypothetical protein